MPDNQNQTTDAAFPHTPAPTNAPATPENSSRPAAAHNQAASEQPGGGPKEQSANSGDKTTW